MQHFDGTASCRGCYGVHGWRASAGPVETVVPRGQAGRNRRWALPTIKASFTAISSPATCFLLQIPGEPRFREGARRHGRNTTRHPFHQQRARHRPQGGAAESRATWHLPASVLLAFLLFRSLLFVAHPECLGKLPHGRSWILFPCAENVEKVPGSSRSSGPPNYRCRRLRRAPRSLRVCLPNLTISSLG